MGQNNTSPPAQPADLRIPCDFNSRTSSSSKFDNKFGNSPDKHERINDADIHSTTPLKDGDTISSLPENIDGVSEAFDQACQTPDWENDIHGSESTFVPKNHEKKPAETCSEQDQPSSQNQRQNSSSQQNNSTAPPKSQSSKKAAWKAAKNIVPQQAIDEYEQGKAFIESGQFIKAEASFTRAIDFLPIKHSDRIVLLFNRAVALVERDKYVEGLKDCAAAIRLAYRGVRFNRTLTQLLLKESKSFKEQLVKVLRLEAYALIAEGRYGEAIKVYVEIISADKSLKKSITVCITQCMQYMKEHGDKLFKQGKFKEAEKVYTEAIIFSLPYNNGDMVLLLCNRAASLLMQNEYTDCVKDCRVAIDMAYNNIKRKAPITPLLEKSGNTLKTILVKALFRKARALEELDRYHGAIEMYERIISLDKSQESQAREGLQQCKLFLYRQQGNNYYENKQYTEAEKCYSNAINTIPAGHTDAILFLNNRAGVYLDQGEYYECLHDCDTGIKSAQTKIATNAFLSPIMKKANMTFEGLLVKLFFRQVQAYKALGEYQDAMEAYQSYIRFGGKEDELSIEQCKVPLHKEQGNSYYKSGQFVKAEASYTQAINMLPADHNDLVLLFNNRAATFMSQGKYEQCLKDCKSAIKLAYEHIASTTPMGPLMKKAFTTTDEQLIKALDRKARVLEVLQRYKEAIITYEEIMDRTYSADKADCIRRCRTLLKRKLEEEAEANLSEAAKEYREREKKKKAEEAEKLAKEGQVNAKLSMWKRGREGDFRALLCSLESVLWPEVLAKGGIILRHSADAKECKKIYRKVIIIIHPDKLPKDSTVEQCLLAKGVFTTLNQSWEDFKTRNNL